MATKTLLGNIKGFQGEQGPMGPAPIKGVDYYTESDKKELISSVSETLQADQILIDNIAERVPFVKVAEQPIYADSITEDMDTSKAYFLPDGYIYTYGKRNTENNVIPNFTNIYNTEKGAYIKNGYRYSNTSQAFVEQSNDCAIVVPVSITTANVENTLRIRGATLEGASYAEIQYIYLGTTNEAFSKEYHGASASIEIDGNGDIVLKFTPNSVDVKYVVFHVAAEVDENALIITQNEEITYIEEGVTLIPNFTNLYNTTKGAYIKNGYRYSNSSGDFVELEGSCAVYIPLGQNWKNNQEFVLRVQGAPRSTVGYGDYCYGLGDTNNAGVTGGNMANRGIYVDESDGFTLTATMNENDNIATFNALVFNVAENSVDEENFIVTFNEEISYTSSSTTTIPNFTNIYNEEKGAYIKDGYRYSNSTGGFVAETTDCAIVVPIVIPEVNTLITLRIRGATQNAVSHGLPSHFYAGTTNLSFSSDNLFDKTREIDENGDIVITFKSTITDYIYCTFSVDAGLNSNNLIITQDEEITYTTIENDTETTMGWNNTGIEYNQPPDYSERVVDLESKTTQLRTDMYRLEKKVDNIEVGPVNTAGMSAFSFAAYPPSPQLPGDGSEEADFNVSDVATSEVYAYMDTLWNRYRTYMVRQNLGKDASSQYDYYRYVFSKAYWRAWYKEGYPKMYAWINDSTIIYSESVSPRIGDTMYTTPYIGTVYNTVTAVNSETIGVASTRMVNNLEFIRYKDGDIEPTIVYTVPIAISDSYKGRTYTDTIEASRSSSISEFTHEYIVTSQGTKFYRYPFEDKKLDGSRLFSVFILANEHGNHGDSMIPCVTVLRILKDLCSNTNNLFLQWLKENAIVTVIPLGNPHGTYRNANSVNINRNYDTPGWAGSDTDPQGGTKEDGDFGPYAGSEIETQYIMNTIQQCKAQTAISCHGRGIPENVLGEYNSSATYQGCGFDPERMFKVEEALFSMYNFGFGPAGQHLTADVGEDENYLNAGKSPSYIEYAGAVGGLIEIDDHEVGTLTSFTPLAMEQAYAEVLLVLQNWVEEALLKE